VVWGVNRPEDWEGTALTSFFTSVCGGGNGRGGGGGCNSCANAVTGVTAAIIKHTAKTFFFMGLNLLRVYAEKVNR
jgi:hypothetical protein